MAKTGLPKLTRGGPRCPECKLDGPVPGEHHVCLGGKCTSCKAVAK